MQRGCLPCLCTAGTEKRAVMQRQSIEESLSEGSGVLRR